MLRSKNVFLTFLLVAMLSTTFIPQTNLVNATSGTPSSISVQLKSYLNCILFDAQYRSQHYKNASVIFKGVEEKALVEAYFKALCYIKDKWARSVEEEIGLPAAYSEFIKLLEEYGWDALRALLYNSPSDFAILVDLKDTFSAVQHFLKYLLPHKCVGLVYDAANKIKDAISDGKDKLALDDAYYQKGVTDVSGILMSLGNICEDEIKAINEVINGKMHPIDLKLKLEKEIKRIDDAAGNISRLLTINTAPVLSKQRKEAFAVFLGELAEFKAYLLTILDKILPNFEVSVDKSVMTVSESGAASLLIKALSKNGFEGDVSLSVEWVGGRPTWVMESNFNPRVVTVKAYSYAYSTLYIAVSDLAKFGEYVLKVVGKCSSASSYKEVKFSVGRLGSIKAEWSISPKIIEVDQSVSIEIKAYFENNTLVPNAAVNAWVIKPDGTKSSVSLNYHASMRKYLGEFWDTSLPGTYRFEADVGKLFYAPYHISDTFKVQKFSYNIDVYAVEDYDYRLTGELTYPYDLNEITSLRGVKYKVTVVAPFDDGILAKVWKNNKEIFYDFLCAGDFLLLDSKELLVYVSGYYLYRVAKCAHLMLQLGTLTGRADINPKDQTVEAGSSCEFTITTSATDRRVIYVYGEPRQWVSFPGIKWSTINDYQKLERKEFYSTTPLSTRLTMRITPPSTAKPGDYNFWVSVMRSPTTRGGDGMNPGDLFLITVTVTPKQYKITLTSTGTRGEIGFGSIVLDGTTYSFYHLIDSTYNSSSFYDLWYYNSWMCENLTVSKYPGNYSITMIPPPGYVFKCWDFFGHITVANTTAEATTILIWGDGALKAIIDANLGNITGRVIDYKTKCGIKSATVACQTPFWYKGYLYGETFTDDNGYFTIDSIPSCTYVVMAYAEGYLPPYSGAYMHSWCVLTVIPNSTVVVNFELISPPRLIVEPIPLIVRQGSNGELNLKLNFLGNPSWWAEMEVEEIWIIPYVFSHKWVIPEDLTVSPDLIIIEPCFVVVDPKDALNFSMIFNLCVSIDAAPGGYCVPIAFCIHAEVVFDFVYVIVQVVPSNAQIQSIDIANQNFDIIIDTNSTSISNFVFDKTTKTISFEVSGPESTDGYCNVTIPKALMEPPFNISINGEQVEFVATENSMFYFIYFTYSHSHKTIQITSQRLLGDSEPPIIVSLTGVEGLLNEGQNLTIYALVMDFDHEVERVWLIYSADGGMTWSLPINMTAQFGHIYTAQITGLKEGDVFIYKIIAEDQAGNTAETEYCQVHVIPEFSSVIFLKLFMFMFLPLIILLKKKSDKR